ncbi:hypothetical protein [Bergeriella denitrificans]|uniref:hypothetical protein n=1 Tax=Bergeriella denitrificans TaxID=494 RepID=UPI001FE68139|nr:hypothetical protein [Bergeriella denitrificans]
MSIADNKRAAELMVDLEEQIAACLVSVSNTDRQTARITGAAGVGAHQQALGRPAFVYPQKPFG